MAHPVAGRRTPLFRVGLALLLLSVGLAALAPRPAFAFRAEVLESVVSVLPLWPGYARGGQPELPPGAAPEGTAVAIAPGGYLVTARHVVERALEISVRLADGRQLPASLIGSDPASDLAVLRIEAELPLLADAPEPALGAPVCAVGNAFGLDLSVSCGVVSALHRSGVGFNDVEDFVQTDASVNPGASGGALVDSQGRLVGILSAIFTKGSDADIGVNFAASIALVRRVVPDLIETGRFVPARSGLQLGDLRPAERRRSVGVRVLNVVPGGAGEAAAIRPGDIVTAIAGRAVRSAAAAGTAFALQRPGDRIELALERAGKTLTLTLVLER